MLTREDDTGGLSPEEFISLAELSFVEKQWDCLVELCQEPTGIDYSTSLLWASPPQSVCSLSLMLLAKQALAAPALLSEHIEKNTTYLVSVIRSGTDDARDYALILLSAFTPSSSQEFKYLLLELRVFNVLCRFMMCSNSHMRMEVAALCHSIYANFPEAQMDFVSAKGGGLLIQLISWSSQDVDRLKVLLQYLEDLMLDSEERPQREICLELTAGMAWEVLRNTQATQVEESIATQVQHLLTTLTIGCRL